MQIVSQNKETETKMCNSALSLFSKHSSLGISMPVALWSANEYNSDDRTPQVTRVREKRNT